LSSGFLFCAAQKEKESNLTLFPFPHREGKSATPASADLANKRFAIGLVTNRTTTKITNEVLAKDTKEVLVSLVFCLGALRG
jgi:hypothetical protein